MTTSPRVVARRFPFFQLLCLPHSAVASSTLRATCEPSLKTGVFGIRRSHLSLFDSWVLPSWYDQAGSTGATTARWAWQPTRARAGRQRAEPSSVLNCRKLNIRSFQRLAVGPGTAWGLRIVRPTRRLPASVSSSGQALSADAKGRRTKPKRLRLHLGPAPRIRGDPSGWSSNGSLKNIGPWRGVKDRRSV